MGLPRSTYYDAPSRKADDAEIIATMMTICDEFEVYGYRRFGAEQTAKATDQISAQVSSIQTSSSEAVSAIRGISGTINQMNEIASMIASAVEEQGSATQEIARNVQQAALGTGEISSNVTGVQQAAGDTGAAAHQVLEASNELSRQSETMRGQVESFLSNIKAA